MEFSEDPLLLLKLGDCVMFTKPFGRSIMS